MALIQHDNKIHQNNCYAAEMNRQVAVAAAVATGGGSAVVAAAIRSAELTYYRALISSGTANNVPIDGFRQALHDIGGVWV